MGKDVNFKINREIKDRKYQGQKDLWRYLPQPHHYNIV